MTGSSIAGRAVTGAMLNGAAPGMLKVMLSTPECRLESIMACLSEPGPLSLTLDTGIGPTLLETATRENSDVSNGAELRVAVDDT